MFDLDDDYEEAQRMAEGEDRLCEECGAPLAVDGACDACADWEPGDYEDDNDYDDLYEDNEPDNDSDDGGEA